MSNYMVAFQEKLDKENRVYLVVYIYESNDSFHNHRQDFIEDVSRGKFNGKKIVKTGILEDEINEICKREKLSVKYVHCKNNVLTNLIGKTANFISKVR